MKKRNILNIALAAALCACMLTGIVTTFADSTDKADSFKVIGYYLGEWFDVPVEKLQAEKLTHVIYGFIVPRADGSVKPFEKPDELVKLIEKCRAAGTQIFISVGGDTDRDGIRLEPVFEKIARDDNVRAKFIDNVMEIVDLYGFDGVELDWECPKPSTSLDYENMVVDLSEKLRPLGKGLSSAQPGTGSTDGLNVWSALSSVSDTALLHFDFINVMCYELMSDPNHSPMWFSNTSIIYWNKVRDVPMEKIILGMPLYAKPSWLQYHELVALDRENAYNDYAATKPAESYYNGLNTFREKTMLALRKAGGVMLFDVNEDTYDETSAVSMIHDTLRAMKGLSNQEIEDYIWVVINNQPVPFYKNDGMGFPLIDTNNRTLVPVRKVLEAIGCSVDWEQRTRTVISKKGNLTVNIPVGFNEIVVNGVSVETDAPAVILDGRTYLPLRAVLEAYGYVVEWDAFSRTVYANDESHSIAN